MKITNILKLCFIYFALFVLIVQTAVFIFPYEEIEKFAETFLNTDLSQLDFGLDLTKLTSTEALYLDLQSGFYLIAVISALVGAVVFSRGRSFTDALGIFVAFLIPRRRKLSGTVYDINKSQPIAFTSIRIVKKTNNREVVVANAVSDLDGTYKISLESITESLYIQARASGYEIYEQALTGLYKNNVIQDIPLKNKKNLQNSLKAYYHSLRPRLINFLIYYLFVLSLLSLFFNTWGPMIFGLNPTSIVYMIIYVIAVVWNFVTIFERIRFRPGRILDFDSKKPVPSAIVSILDDKDQLQAAFSDIHGVVRVNLHPGLYKIKVSKNFYQMVNSEGDVVENESFLIEKDGYLPEDIFIKKFSENESENENSTDSLLNPFGA